MFDEVQTGNGRCGSAYVFEQMAVEPDVLLTAKGLGNGLPIGVCMAKGIAAEQLGPGDHGSTYGGNPLCCAAAQAVLTTLTEENVMSQADHIRDSLLTALHGHLADPTLVTEVRGRGLMIGIQPNTATDQIVQRGLDRGLLLNIAGRRYYTGAAATGNEHRSRRESWARASRTYSQRRRHSRKDTRMSAPQAFSDPDGSLVQMKCSDADRAGRSS